MFLLKGEDFDDDLGEFLVFEYILSFLLFLKDLLFLGFLMYIMCDCRRCGMSSTTWHVSYTPSWS